MAYDIFISYRREDGKEIARQLQLKLQVLGYKAFLDVEELKDGVFDQRIIDAIESSKVFLAVLTPRYLSRCANENDWVRKEIECASKNNIRIVPINLDKRFTEFPDDCPLSIRNEIGQHQFTEVFTGQHFSTTMNYLDENRLRPFIKKGKEDSFEGAIIHIDTDMDCKIEIFGKEVCSVKKGEDKTIRLLQGNKKIKAISAENPQDFIEFIYRVPNNNCEEIMEVKLKQAKDARLCELEKQKEEKLRKRKEVIEQTKKRIEEERRKRVEEQQIREKEIKELRELANTINQKKSFWKRYKVAIILAPLFLLFLMVVCAGDEENPYWELSYDEAYDMLEADVESTKAELIGDEIEAGLTMTDIGLENGVLTYYCEADDLRYKQINSFSKDGIRETFVGDEEIKSFLQLLVRCEVELEYLYYLEDTYESKPIRFTCSELEDILSDF